MNVPDASPAGELRTRTVKWAEPVRDLSEFRSLSGLEYLQRLFGRDSRPAPICALMDFRVVKFEYGLAVFEGTPREFHYNPVGVVHGIFAAALLDSALGCCVHTTLKPGFGSTTIELKINYVRALSSESGLVTSVGRTINVGSRIATAEARLTGADGRLYAHGTSTCMIFPL